MDWAAGIQRALDYTEAHLMEEIDCAAVASRACSSAFHFQRIFSVVCGVSLGEYIRLRRLTLAAEDLIRTREKVIDIALKYGYDAPESFSRAFARFHGISPTEARRGETVKSFSRLSVRLMVSGGSTMEYRIERREAFQVICRRKRIAGPQGESAEPDIAALWRRCGEDGTIEALCRYGRFDRLGGILGISFSEEMVPAGFPYGIGAEYGGLPVEDERLELVDIPAHTYAVFPCRGKMPEIFQSTYRRICTEFFPQSNYAYGNGVELEVYPSAEVQDPAYACEIWVAVTEKA